MSAPKEGQVRKAIDGLVKDRVAHEQRTGKALPDTRKIEREAADIARRNERRRSDGR